MMSKCCTGLMQRTQADQADLNPSKPQFQSSLPAAVTLLGQDALSHLSAYADHI